MDQKCTENNVTRNYYFFYKKVKKIKLCENIHINTRDETPWFKIICLLKGIKRETFSSEMPLVQKDIMKHFL